MSKRAFVALFAILLVALTGAPALAAPPLGVEFEVPTFVPPEGGPTFGPLVASGSAVDAGLMCETGQTIDISGTATGLQSKRGVNYHITKMFTCDDGSGDFVVKLEARVDWKGDNSTGPSSAEPAPTSDSMGSALASVCRSTPASSTCIRADFTATDRRPARAGPPRRRVSTPPNSDSRS